jgi:hypothetical protein
MNGLDRWQRNRRRSQAQKRLDTVQVAKPCPASWDEMKGDKKVRFCAHCRLNVFNLSAMDVEEAANLIAAQDGRLCVRFYRRRDGTILTQDCPVGVAAWKKRLSMVWSSTAGACMAVLGGFVGWSHLSYSRQATTGMLVSSAPEGVEPIPVDIDRPVARVGEPMVGAVRYSRIPDMLKETVGTRDVQIQGHVRVRR